MFPKHRKIARVDRFGG